MLLNLKKTHPIDSLQPVVDGMEIPSLGERLSEIHLDQTVTDYIVDLVFATRNHKALLLGASPRGTLALYQTSRALAALDGRDFVLPDDVKTVVKPVLAHRCLVHPESALRGLTIKRILDEILEQTPLEIGDL